MSDHAKQQPNRPTRNIASVLWIIVILVAIASGTYAVWASGIFNGKQTIANSPIPPGNPNTAPMQSTSPMPGEERRDTTSLTKTGTNSAGHTGTIHNTPTSAEAGIVGKKLPVICIDPGHPSEVNRGTTEQNGLREVEIVYDVALRLKKNLENPDDPIARVVMTRDFRTGTSKVVTNRERAEIANRNSAVLLVRLHCDTGKGTGYTIYFPDQVGKAKDGKTGPSHRVITESRRAAKAFHAGMDEIIHDAPTNLHDNGIKGDSATYIGGKQGALTGSVYSEVPALTVEMVYLSNPNDARSIGSNDGQQMMADALTFGIIRTLEAFSYRSTGIQR